MINCKINCETLTCEFCGKKISGCDVKRNCNPKSEPLPPPEVEIKPVVGGPGTELKKLLSKLGIDPKNGCKCADRARHMDFMESQAPGWTETNIELILDWLQREASNRGIPFIRAAAKLLVKLAIRRAKKE